MGIGSKTKESRNDKMVEMWKAKNTLQEIGDKFGISKQRVHRIVNKINGSTKPIPPQLKKVIFKKDNFTCQKCGTKENLTINHIVPRIAGGTNITKNLETLCYKCNRQEFSELTKRAIVFYFLHHEPPYRKK